MNKNDKNQIEEKLRSSSASYKLPDLKTSIKDRYILEGSMQLPAKKPRFSFKKLIPVPFSTAITVAAIATIIIVYNMNKEPQNQYLSVASDYSPIALTEKNEQIAYSVISASGIIASNSSSDTDNYSSLACKPILNNYSEESVHGYSGYSKKHMNDDTSSASDICLKNSSSFSSTSADEVISLQLEKLNPYMITIESMLKNSFKFGCEIDTSDNVNYDNKLNISDSLLDGLSYTRTLYYNKSTIDFDTRIDGSFSVSSSSYEFNANVNSSTSLFNSTTYLNPNDRSEYLNISQETESNSIFGKTKYVYSHYVSNVLATTVALQYGKENSGKSPVVFADFSDKTIDGSRFMFRLGNNEKEIKAVSDGTTDFRNFNIDIVGNDDGTTSYVYSNNSFSNSFGRRYRP